MTPFCVKPFEQSLQVKSSSVEVFSPTKVFSTITDDPGGPPPDGPGHLNFQPVRSGVSQSCLTNDVADLGGVGDDETQPGGI